MLSELGRVSLHPREFREERKASVGKGCKTGEGSATRTLSHRTPKVCGRGREAVPNSGKLGASCIIFLLGKLCGAIAVED